MSTGKSKDEIVNGLKAGKVLIVDGSAKQAELEILQELEDQGLIDSKFIDNRENQYSYYRVWWKNLTRTSA